MDSGGKRVLDRKEPVKSSPRQEWAWCVSVREGGQRDWISVSKVEEGNDGALITQGPEGHCKGFG